MSDINKVILIGRLVRDPELKNINGTALVSFSLASGRTYTHNGEKKEETVFIDCSLWGKMADIVNKYCSKGKQVCVSGYLKQNTWQDKEGNKRSKIEIVCENVQFLGGGKQEREPVNQNSQPEKQIDYDDDIPF